MGEVVPKSVLLENNTGSCWMAKSVTRVVLRPTSSRQGGLLRLSLDLRSVGPFTGTGSPRHRVKWTIEPRGGVRCSHSLGASQSSHGRVEGVIERARVSA